MPIYEYYCPENHTVYQFYAKTLAQGQLSPRCPDNPRFRMQRLVSSFAITTRGRNEEPSATEPSAPGMEEGGDDARMAQAMNAMESEFANIDENDPKAMGRMMRRMAELTGEKLDGEMEEVVRKLEEGADPDALEAQFGDDAAGDDGAEGEGPEGATAPEAKERRHRFRVRRAAPRRDPKLYDFE